MSDTPDVPESEDLLDAITDFVNAGDWVATRTVLDQHPELLSPTAERLFYELIERAGLENEEKLVLALIAHRDLLRLCNEIGIDAAFTQIQAQSVSEAPDLLDMIAQNTILVLTTAPEEHEQWLAGIRQLATQAREAEDMPMVNLTDAITRLLLGDDPVHMEVELEGSQVEVWELIVSALIQNKQA